MIHQQNMSNIPWGDVTDLIKNDVVILNNFSFFHWVQYTVNRKQYQWTRIFLRSIYYLCTEDSLVFFEKFYGYIFLKLLFEFNFRGFFCCCFPITSIHFLQLCPSTLLGCYSKWYRWGMEFLAYYVHFGYIYM